MSKISKVSLSHFGFNVTYLSRGRKTLDEMLAWNLDAHVMGMCHDHDFGATIVLNKFALCRWLRILDAKLYVLSPDRSDMDLKLTNVSW